MELIVESFMPIWEFLTYLETSTVSNFDLLYARCSGPFSNEGSLSCQCDTEPRFLNISSKMPTIFTSNAKHLRKDEFRDMTWLPLRISYLDWLFISFSIFRTSVKDVVYFRSWGDWEEVGSQAVCLFCEFSSCVADKLSAHMQVRILQHNSGISQIYIVYNHLMLWYSQVTIVWYNIECFPIHFIFFSPLGTTRLWFEGSKAATQLKLLPANKVDQLHETAGNRSIYLIGVHLMM